MNGGGFGGPKNSSKSKLTEDRPKRNPDATMVESTSVSQVMIDKLNKQS